MAPSEFDDKYDHMEEIMRRAKRRMRETDPGNPLGHNERVTVENEAGKRVMFNARYFHDALMANVGDEVTAKTTETEAYVLREAGLVPGKKYRVEQVDEFPTDRKIVRMALGEIPTPAAPELFPPGGMLVHVRVGDRVVPVHSDMLAGLAKPKPGDTVRLRDVATMLPHEREQAADEGLQQDVPYEVVLLEQD